MIASVSLLSIVYRYRREIAFGWTSVVFGMFIVACGFVPFMHLVGLRQPNYWIAADIELAAAALTVIAFPFMVSRIGALLAEAKSAKRNERRFRAAAESSNDCFFILASERDEGGEIVDFRFEFVNETAAGLLFSSRDNVVGQLLCEGWPINRSGGFFEKYKRVTETGMTLVEDFAIDSPTVNATWLRFQVVKLEDGVAISTSNISVRKEAELALVRALEFNRSLIASSPFAIMAMGIDGTIVEINPAGERMLKYTRNELVGKCTPLLFLDPDEIAARASLLSAEFGHPVAPDMQVFLEKATHGLTDEAEWTYLQKDGARLPVHQMVAGLLGRMGEISGLLSVAYDITERKRFEDSISHMAGHDALTGLPTRSLLHDRIGVALDHARSAQTKVAVLVLDLDNFKEVNNSRGHHAGDELLVAVAARLRGALRETDTLARMGGDEFVAMLEDLRSSEEAEIAAQDLLNALATPIVLHDEINIVTVSIGVCVYPESGEDGETLLRNADAAMYQAKTEGRNTCQTFTASMAAAAEKRRIIRNALPHALSRSEFTLVYQPQVSTATGEVTGVEALLRWNSQELGTVMPGDFISLAEESGAILPIGEWVLRTACRRAAELQKSLGRPLVMAVNLSPRQFQQEHLPALVEGALVESGLDPGLLELEITENVLVSDSSKTRRVLESLRALGIRISIDDFGTGYSSMSYILRFSANRLKIDRSFIHDSTTNPNSRAITLAVIALAHGLNIGVVAEGVETLEVAEALANAGCDEAQGMYYSLGVPIENLLAVIHSLSARASHSVDCRIPQALPLPAIQPAPSYPA